MHGAMRPPGSHGEPQPSTRLSLSHALCPCAGAYPAGRCSSIARQAPQRLSPAPAPSPAAAHGHRLPQPHCSAASAAPEETRVGGAERTGPCSIARRCRGPTLAWHPLPAQPVGLAQPRWQRPTWAPAMAWGGQYPPGVPRAPTAGPSPGSAPVGGAVVGSGAGTVRPGRWHGTALPASLGASAFPQCGQRQGLWR